MILHKLTLSNFRQFKGVQVITFACPSENQSTNISIFFGQNGRGKTGIFRAIVFCLFGVKRLSQDGDVPESEIQLVNTNVLGKSQGATVEAFVELFFSHEGVKYCLKRSIIGLIKDGDVIEEMGSVKLSSTKSDGNTKVIDKHDIDSLVEKIINPRVKDYFFFDGETIERLTRASVEQRKEISKGIRNLLDVDALETAIRATAKLTRKLESEMREHSTPELARLLKELKDNEDKEKEKKERLDGVAEELRIANRQLKDIDKELEKFKAIRHFLEERKRLEETLKNFQNDSKDLLSEMKTVSAKMAIQLVGNNLKNVFYKIDNLKKRGDIPSEIRKDLVEKILNEHWCCVCDRAVDKGSDAEKKVLEWLHKATDIALQDSALDLWRYLSDVINRFSDDGTQIENMLLSYGNLRNKIDNARMKLQKISDQIGEGDFGNVPVLEQARGELKEKILKLEAEDLVITNEINVLLEERKLLFEKIEKEKQIQDKGKEVIKRANLARKSLEALNAVYDGFTEEIKHLISEKATLFLKKFLDSEGQEAIRKVLVKDDYSLQVLDRWERPFLANISAGQRQIMSIAFIVALAEVAAQDKLLEMPLFMDTPLGRLSGDHRANLISFLPQFSSQWILLVTDTEFTKTEGRLFKSSPNWGKFFVLEPDGQGNTEIHEKNIDSYITLLNDEGEDE